MNAHEWLFALGEYVAGLVLAVATAAALHAIVHPGWDLVLAMLLGVAVGTVFHVVATLLFGPWVGTFQVMASGSLIGSYGGMLFAMRDAMQLSSWGNVLQVAVIFGLILVFSTRVYDRSLRPMGA